MKKFALIILAFAASLYCASAQYVTRNVNPYAENDFLRWKVYSVVLDEDATYITFEITALRKIKGLWCYNGYFNFNTGANRQSPHIALYSDKLNYYGNYLQGIRGKDGKINNVEYTRGRGWESVNKGEIVYITLCFLPIPESAKDICLVDFTLSYNNHYSTWNVPLKGLENPRRNYVPLWTESAIKEHLDVNNDGICGIYEEVGGRYNARYAVVKHNDTHTLIYMSDDNNLPWWNIGDIKATLQPTTTNGLFKATCFMDYKEESKNNHVTFDGTSMTATFGLGNTTRFVRMYPTEPPSYERINEAIEQLENENFQSAIKTLSNIIASKSTNNETRYSAYMLRAYSYIALDFLKSALEDYNKALECKPGDEEALYQRGRLKVLMDDVEGGIEDLKRGGEMGRAILREYDLLDNKKPQGQTPPLKKQSIPQLKKQK